MSAEACQMLRLAFYYKQPAELVIDEDDQSLTRFRPAPLLILTSTPTTVVPPGAVR